VIARLGSSIQSLLHQHRDLHQLTYLYLMEEREPTSHMVVRGFGNNIRVATLAALFTLSIRSQGPYSYFTILSTSHRAYLTVTCVLSHRTSV
jgi:hypothetical protein